MGAGLAGESFIKLVKFLLTSRVMVLPVRVFTKICMVAPTSLTSETNPIDQHKIGETHIVNTIRKLFGLLGFGFHVSLGHRIGRCWLPRFGSFQGCFNSQILRLGQLRVLLDNSSIGVELQH